MGVIDLSGKTFVITGATGRLGSEMVKRLREFGANVLPIVLKGGNNYPKRTKWSADVFPISMEKNKLHLMQDANYIINFHWKTDRTLSFSNQLKYDLDHSLFDNIFFWEWFADKKIEKFINISSIKIFSHLNQEPITSLSCPKPNTPYGIAKELSELYFGQLYHKSMFRVTNIRLTSIASNGEHPTHLISQMYQSAFQGKKITVNAGHQSYLMYVEEAIDLIIAAALYGNEQFYNFGGEGFLNEEIAAEFELLSKKKLIADYENLFPGIKNMTYLFDNNKFGHSFVRRSTLQELLSNYLKLNSSLENN